MFLPIGPEKGQASFAGCFNDTRLAGQEVPFAILENKDIGKTPVERPGPEFLTEFAPSTRLHDFPAHDDADIPRDGGSLDGSFKSIARHPAIGEHVHQNRFPQDAIGRAIDDVVWMHEGRLRLGVTVHDDTHLFRIRGAKRTLGHVSGNTRNCETEGNECKGEFDGVKH
jgi:hypothetical protein